MNGASCQSSWVTSAPKRSNGACFGIAVLWAVSYAIVMSALVAWGPAPYWRGEWGLGEHPLVEHARVTLAVAIPFVAGTVHLDRRVMAWTGVLVWGFLGSGCLMWFLALSGLI